MADRTNATAAALYMVRTTYKEQTKDLSSAASSFQEKLMRCWASGSSISAFLSKQDSFDYSFER